MMALTLLLLLANLVLAVVGFVHQELELRRLKRERQAVEAEIKRMERA